MTTLFVRRSGFVFVGLLLCLTVASCDLISEEKCGSRFDAEDSGSNTSFAAWETFVANGNRIYRRVLKVDNVCPDEHVTATFNLAFAQTGVTLQLPLSVRGRIEWSLVFPSEEVFLANNLQSVANLTSNGKVEAGLKQVFGEDPATYFVIYEVFFPTTGVASRDLAYVMDHIDLWQMETRYFEFPSE